MTQAVATEAASPVRWGQRRRLEFIDFRLRWDGRINRAEIVDFFGVSIPQASLDLARYREVAPNNLIYDASEKVYRAGTAFSPALIPADARSYLDQLFVTANGTLPVSASFLGWRPPCDMVVVPSRAVRPEILVRLLWAIRDGEELQVIYQSLREPDSAQRWIAPHALAFDGGRWHARAWCKEEGVFRDFVIARIQRVLNRRPSSQGAALDARWHTLVDVKLRTKRGLSDTQRAAVEAEFGMKSGLLTVRMREAMVYYFVRELHLDSAPDVLTRPPPLDWVNRDQLVHLLREAAHP